MAGGSRRAAEKFASTWRASIPNRIWLSSRMWMLQSRNGPRSSSPPASPTVTGRFSMRRRRRAGIAEALRRGRALDATGETFLHAITPARRTIIVGATHIAQHLAVMATASGYDVKVIDPRTAFTSPARFEPSQIVGGWPEDGLAKLAADRSPPRHADARR